MAITALDPNTALIVVDLQKGIVSLPTVHPASEIVRRAATLADAFRRLSLQVVLVNVTTRPPGRTEQSTKLAFPADFADLVPELNRQPSDIVVTKRTAGAFTSTNLEEQLKDAGVTQVVIVGVATSMGVEATARHAYALGFNVILAVDAMTDLDPDAHAHSIAKVFPRLGETGTSQDVIDRFGRRA